MDLANEQSEAEAIAMSLAAASINTTSDNEEEQEVQEVASAKSSVPSSPVRAPQVSVFLVYSRACFTCFLQ